MNTPYDDVGRGFDLLVRAIDTAVHNLNADGATALHAGDLAAARAAIDRSEALTGIANRLRECRRDAARLFQTGAAGGDRAITAPPGTQDRRHRADAVRETETLTPERHRRARPLKQGRATPRSAFRRPILETLEQLGGSAKTSVVLDAVENIMAHRLTAHDREYLPSTPCVRWRETAHWCRYLLVKEGSLSSGSPRGVWTLTEMGRNEIERLRSSS